MTSSQVIHYALNTSSDKTEIRFIYSNKTEEDILCKKEFQELSEKFQGRFKLVHVLSDPADDWKGEKGHVDRKMMEKHFFPPSDDTGTFLCGPPGLIKACTDALYDWGFEEDKNVFGF